MGKKYNNIEDLPLGLTVDDIGEVLGLGKNRTYDLVHSKGFPCIQVGRRLIIPKLAFVRWMESPL